MTALHTRLRRPLGIVTALGVLVSGLVLAQPQIATAATGPAPNEQRSASTVTADPLPTVQIDSGIVWTQTIVGNTVYAGGSFSNARPAGAAPGTNLIPRKNILAYDITTGVITSFAPVINGTIKAMASSPDGKRLYVGGTFTSVGGQSRFNIAAFDTTTGALLTTFKASVGGSYVNAIVATDSTVYVGGLIGAGNGVTRKNFAAFRADTGGLRGWAPTSDLQVDAMVLAPTGDKIIAGGRFSLINDAPQRGLAALDLTDGSLLPWQAPSVVKNGMGGTGPTAGKAGIHSLSADANSVYGTGWVYANVATGNLEGTFSAASGSGAINWIADCHGDHYGVYSDGTNVYTTSHQHACESMGGPPQLDPAPGNLRHATAYTAAAKGTLSRSPQVSDKYADWSGYPAPAAINWYPDWTTGTASGQGQAGWSVTGNGKYVVVGGEFPFVNGKPQQGLVRFSNTPPGGPDEAPRLSGTRWEGYVVRSVSAGTVRITIPANWDRDDLDLTYRLYREGTSTPLQSKTVSSRFWDRPVLSFVDSGRAPGSTQTYRVVASDADGNTANSVSSSVVISDQTPSEYAETVLNDGANLFWRLGTPAGTTEADWAGANDGTVRAGVSVTSGAVLGDPSGASSFTGTDTGNVASSRSVPVGSQYSVEAWFRTTTTAGGKIVGYGTSGTALSNSYDRHVYMTNTGRVAYGNFDTTTRTITSAGSYNDGRWHHVVGTQGPNGMQLLIDGRSAGTLAAATRAEGYNGYWRVGGDNLNGWPNRPTANFFNGQVDEFAVYPSALTASQAATHFALGKGNPAPKADFSVTAQELSASFDASTSSAPSGETVTSYRWNFGDDTAEGSGVSPTHTYAAAGSYTVTLTVTSSGGLSSTTSKPVTVSAAHAKPVAVIANSTSGLTGSFDGTGSTTSDGATISGYKWDFGDGDTSTAAKPTHAYSAAGTYKVTLTVTDSLGATSAAAAAEVSVTHAAPVATFVTHVAGLTANVDASASTASDGASLTYSWNWGDGTASSAGVTATHAYSSAATRTVTLTVTDSKGSSATASQQVTTADQAFLASDDFERSVTSGWGTAPAGGSWSTTTGLSVSAGQGKITSTPGQTKTTLLSGVNVEDVDVAAEFSYDKVANGGGTHFNLLSRKTAAGDYRLKVRVSAAGAVTVNLGKVVGTTETLFAGKTLTGYTAQAGAALDVRLNVVTSGGTTQLQAKVWPAGTAEPATWTTTATDSTPELQEPGKVGVSTYLTGSATNGPLVTSVDALRVK